MQKIVDMAAIKQNQARLRSKSQEPPGTIPARHFVEPRDTQPIELCKVFKSLPVDSKERVFLLKFWLRMAEVYRQLWTTSQGLLPTDIWATVLLKIGEQAAIEGLVFFVKQGQTFPPTLPEFYQASYRKKTGCFAPFVALPRPQLDKAVVFEYLKTIKTSLKMDNNHS